MTCINRTELKDYILIARVELNTTEEEWPFACMEDSHSRCVQSHVLVAFQHTLFAHFHIFKSRHDL